MSEWWQNLMPKRRGGKWRVVDKVSGRIVRDERGGLPLDGGGHATKAKTIRQIGHVVEWYQA